MIAIFTRSAVRSIALRAPMACGARFMSSLGDTLEKKGKVEEDRYMRALDAAQLAKIQGMMAEQAAAAAATDEASQFNDHVAPVMEEIKGLLASEDSLGDASLESLARWKLGL